MGANDDDHHDDHHHHHHDSSLWNDKLLQTLKAEHDRLFNDLRTETTRLERDLNTAAGSSAGGPFSAFKKIIDTGISSITTALHPRPSHSAELDVKLRMQRAQDRQRAEEQDISQRWTGSTDSPDHVQLQNSRRSAQEKEGAVDAAAELLEMAQMRNSDVPAEMVEALYRDPEANMLDMEILGGIPSFQPHWLSVNWFKRSSYSPIRLEAHPQLGEHGAKWRAAFEDLLNASLDKPMGSMERVGMRVPHGRPQSTFTGPGLEWMLSLQCRGILPMQLPRTYNHVHAVRELRHSFVTDLLEQRNLFSNHTRPDSSNDAPLAADFHDLVSEVGTKATADTEAEPLPVRLYPATEHDLYESTYLCPVTPEGPSKSDVQRGCPLQENPTAYNNVHAQVMTKSCPTGQSMSKKAEMISTWTTTHTTRLPDGTVTTTVVLKQRFADGREETTTESFHTRNEARPDEAQREEETPCDEKSTTKRGWFWS